jgi:hypothetical protein
MKTNRRETISLLAGAAPAVLGALSAAGAANLVHAKEAKPRGRITGTGQDRPHIIETRIGRLEFTHDFANGYPTDATVEKLYDERDFQRGCQAYLWSLPAVSFASWQRGITKGLGAKNGQIVAILSLEARRGILTANATTPYYLGFADLSSGPFVLEMPARDLQGAMNDAWQNAIPGTEAPRQVSRTGAGAEDAGERRWLHRLSLTNCQHLSRRAIDRRRSRERETGTGTTGDVSLHAT